jgi:glycosyltransferase involved in cell wall biosynthesis
LRPLRDATAELSPRVLIVAEHASARFGGEAVIPLHVFRLLRQRGVDAYLLVHERTRAELSDLLPQEHRRISYIPDTAAHRVLWRFSQRLPDRMAYFTSGWLMRLLTQWEQRKLAIRLVRAHGIEVVHQPIPVSPKEPSLLFALGAPVIIGPMNGGMDYPPGFREAQGVGTTCMLMVGRALASLLNLVMPGKTLARLLLLANERTLQALPATASKNRVMLVENGVDFLTWTAPQNVPPTPHDDAAIRVSRFLFMGRLVDWKAVNLLLDAFAQAQNSHPMTLTLLGDGPEGPSLRAQAARLGILATAAGEIGKVHFEGWQPQTECARYLHQSSALILPSLMECGGAVVLEAMAAGRAVIASDWGGPADYLDAECGILVSPQNPAQFTAALGAAMVKLAESPELCEHMGQKGFEKVRQQFDWQRKIDTIIELYRGVTQARNTSDL